MPKRFRLLSAILPFYFCIRIEKFVLLLLLVSYNVNCISWCLVGHLLCLMLQHKVQLYR